MGCQEVIPELDYSDYRGEWVVICDGRIIAHDKDLTKIDKEISRCRKAPTVAKIPAEGQLIF